MIIRIVKGILIVFGCIMLLLVILCFTSLPFWCHYGMGVKYAGINRPPEYIVVLGGGAMPGSADLMRTYYAAELAGRFQKARVIISLPGDTSDPSSSVSLMKREMAIRGINPGQIVFESRGTNTRYQALCLREMLGDTLVRFSNFVLVTSPVHLYRAYLAFKKAGFVKVDGLPAFENGLESGLLYEDKMLGGRRLVPGIGKNLTLRYRFWTQLEYEQQVIREAFALAYYRIKGWI
jgi:uncharacterized SAM-binding protein YcdF (DUF218 family)